MKASELKSRIYNLYENKLNQKELIELWDLIDKYSITKEDVLKAINKQRKLYSDFIGLELIEELGLDKDD